MVRAGRSKLIRQEDEPAALVQIVEANTAKRIRIVFRRGCGREHESVIGAQPSALVNGPRLTPSQDAGLGAGYEECAATMEGMETPEVQVAAVHHVERTGFRKHPIENIHVMKFSIGSLNESWDRATQVQ